MSTTPPTPCPEPFGEKSWTDVHDVVRGVIHRKWRDISQDDLEDATQTAMLDLVDYWVNLDSSITADNTGQNFRFAVQRGVWTGMSYIAAMLNERNHHTTLYSTSEDGEEEYESMADQGAGPEDIVIALLEREELSRLLARTPDHELDPWLMDYLSDETETAVAGRLGISQPAVSQRWSKGLRRLRAAA